MGIYDKSIVIPRKTMVLFFLVDTSGSMKGPKIGAVNTAIEDVLPEVAAISGENADALIKIAVLEFSTGCKWLTPTPVEVDQYSWTYLEAGGLTDMGEALDELNRKLSRSAFMNEVAGSFAPVIFMLSDGGPNDDYKKSLAALQANNWFRKAIKVAVAIGDDADKDVLAEFTGNVETVLEVHTPQALKKMIRFLVVTSSQIGSKSSGTPQQAGEVVSKADEFAEQLKTADLDAVDPPAEGEDSSDEDLIQFD